MSLFPRQPRLRFFDLMLDKPKWQESTVLDIGGNRGNLLIDATMMTENSRKFQPSAYTCMEVDKEAIEAGKSSYPEANWVHHNAFNNVDGIDELAFPFADNTFDIVCAYSVYSHTTFKQFIHDLLEVLRVCKPNGSIAITLVDIGSVKYFVEKRKEDYNELRLPINWDDIKDKGPLDYVYYVDSDLLLDEIYSRNKMTYLVTVYNLKWLSTWLKTNLQIENEVKYPPQGHVQRTIVIKNNDTIPDVSKLQELYNENNNLVDIHT